MYHCKKNGWKWTIKTENLLDNWFSHFEELAEKNCIKSNDVRSVFTSENLFVKYDKPQKLLQKIRSLFFPKSRSEFNTGIELERLNIPVVRHLGWGRCYSKGLLVTEAYTNTICARDYWFKEVANSDTKSKYEFIEELMNIIRLLIDNSFYHPDFHLGNILIDTKSKKMALVDVYGMKQTKSLTQEQKKELTRVFILLREHLSDEFCVNLLNEFTNDSSKASDLWNTYLKEEQSRVEKLWIKRCWQIESFNEKYCTILKNDGKEFILKHNQTRSPIIEVNSAIDIINSNALTKVEYSRDKAQELWLKSFKLQFHALTHIRPLIWERSKTTDVLYFEQANPTHHSNNGSIKDFQKRCMVAGLIMDTNIIIEKYNGMLCIKDINNVNFK